MKYTHNHSICGLSSCGLSSSGLLSSGLSSSRGLTAGSSKYRFVLDPAVKPRDDANSPIQVSRAYSPELDGLRAIAAGVVLLFHAKVPGFGAGFFGVDIFFVLSGYLITQLLVSEHERTGTIDYKRFFKRRLCRLYPALLLFIVAYLIIAPAVFTRHGMDKHLQDAVISALYLADYAKTFGEPIKYISHVWTLGVEAKFYLLWPFVIAMMMGIPRAQAVQTLALMFVMATLWRAHNVFALSNYWLVYNRFDTHLSGLILGSCLGFSRIKLGCWAAWLGGVVLAITLTLAYWKGVMTAVFGFTTAEVAAGFLICSPPQWLGKGVLPWLGRMSYGFYLWHYLFIRIGREYDMGFLPIFLMGTIGGLVCAVLSYYSIEASFRAKSK